jgi:hypothetical protein
MLGYVAVTINVPERCPSLSLSSGVAFDNSDHEVAALNSGPNELYSDGTPDHLFPICPGYDAWSVQDNFHLAFSNPKAGVSVTCPSPVIPTAYPGAVYCPIQIQFGGNQQTGGGNNPGGGNGVMP